MLNNKNKYFINLLQNKTQIISINFKYILVNLLYNLTKKIYRKK